MRIKKMSHVAVAYPDLDGALERFGAVLGLAPTVRETVAAQSTEVALLPVGGSAIELIRPRGNEGLERFLAKRGPGLHHISLEVEDLPAALAALRAAGVPLVDETPRAGARGHRVAFVHPRALGGLLIELEDSE